MKVLVSFFAFRNDFANERGSEVNVNGPTFNFHNTHFDELGIDRHVILAQDHPDNESLRFLKLKSELIRAFDGDRFDFRPLDIKDVISHSELISKIGPVLLAYREDEIYLYISPGTGAMQASLLLSHMTLGLNSHVIQVRDQRYTQTGRSEVVHLDIARDQLISSVMIKEVSQSDSFKKADAGEYLVSDSLKPLYALAARAAQTDATVLIQGASGTGKEHLASYIHQQSPRAKRPYESINCSAFTDALLRSELFGHEKGAFTGADKKKEGIIVANNGGTVFLDEIGDISPFMQQALLRVLQQKEVRPVGSGKSHKITTRFIAATNADLLDRCEKGEFRWDLYYRLSVVDLHLPILLDRGKTEVKLYIEHFNRLMASRYSTKPKKIDKAAMETLLRYGFPGNVRELVNLIERLYVLVESDVIQSTHLPKRILSKSESRLSLDSAVLDHIHKVLEYNGGNERQTARDLGIALNTLRKKLGKY